MCAGVGPLAYIAAGLAGLRPGFLERGGVSPYNVVQENFSTRISSRERSGRELFSGAPEPSGGFLNVVPEIQAPNLL